MNREIKFRVWNPESQTMRTVQLCDYMGFHGVVYDYVGCNNPDNVWMQFTGLQDKHGVDIYEGDVVYQEIWVSVGKYAPSIGVIKYKGIKFTSECIGEWKGSNADLNRNASVIGNIHEILELINK